MSDSYIYETFGTADELDKNENELITGFASKKLGFNFNSNITKFTINGTLDETNVYRDGNLSQYRKLYKTVVSNAKKIQTVGKKVASQTCIDWYWITDYSDGTQTVQYLGRTCDCNGEHQSNAIRDTKGTMTIKLFCDGGDGGPSGGEGPCPPQTSHYTRNGKVSLTIKSNCVPSEPSIYDLFKIDAAFENYYLQLTPAEQAIARAHPIDAFQVYLNSNEAFSQANALFPGSQHNTVADAFRHAYWIALNVKSVGPVRAKEFSDAHENFPNNPAMEMEMDMDFYNNSVGQRIMSQLAFYILYL